MVERPVAVPSFKKLNTKRPFNTKVLLCQMNIIHVGAHNDGEWNWGICDTPKSLEKMGYAYFRYSSFYHAQSTNSHIL